MNQPTPEQNRAYAASQLSDLAQKLAKAQPTVTNTRAAVPKIQREKDEKGKVSASFSVDGE